MALENLVGADKFVSALVPANPVGADDKREGDDHLRGIKNTLRNTFPNLTGAVTATQAELSSVTAKVSKAGDTMTGGLKVSVAASAEALRLSGTDAFQAFHATADASRYGYLTWNATAIAINAEGAVSAGLATANGNLLLTAAGALVFGPSAFYANAKGIINASSSVNGAPLALRNNQAAVGKFWRVGPFDGTSSIIVFNQDGVGTYMTDGGTAWLSSSDERLKTDLMPIEGAADKVAQLRAVTGRFVTDEPGVSRAFLVAQDVQAVLPEAVGTDPNGMLGLAYTDVIPLLVGAIKELRAELAMVRDLAGV